MKKRASFTHHKIIPWYGDYVFMSVAERLSGCDPFLKSKYRVMYPKLYK